MSGHVWPRVVFAAPLVVLLAGCTEDVTSYPLNRYTGGSADQQGSSTVDQTPVTTSDPVNEKISGALTPEAPATVTARYRDVAAYTWTDRAGNQWLSQTLLAASGTTVFTRACPIDPDAGIVWSQCDAWGTGIPVAHLGMPATAVSGIGAFTYARAGARGPTLVQTALSADGLERYGRVCTIEDKEIVLSSCTAWDKLAEPSLYLGIDGQLAFRDHDAYVLTDHTGAQRFGSRLLSADGGTTWEQTCSTVGDILSATKSCTFKPVSVSSFDEYLTTRVAGLGAYVYKVRSGQIYAETTFSLEGSHTARRECKIDTTEGVVDFTSCSPWSYGSVATLLKTKTML